ncbi:potassium channel family protein [Beduini massiliensis]|uniref:potassium channel family protein n=1 Tax=Beduini massiliensis TaxID=1585974 RepID=UPI00059A7F6D|nr:TrkA family potassium uptake protein [Beduini massiliensis]
MSNKRKQFAVIGLGVFGSTIASSLAKMGYEVLAVDRDITCVERIADTVTKAVQADATDINELRTLGISEFDTVIVAIGNHLEESMLSVMNVKELGVPYVLAKAKNKQFMQILLKIGADRVVRSEKEMGERVAKSLVRKNIIDIIEVDNDYSIIEMKAPASWIGKTLKTLNVRSAYKMNILAIRYANQEKLVLSVDPNYVIEDGDHFLVLGETEAVEKYDYLIEK